MATIATFLNQLQQVGFFRIALPFLFTFAAVYGLVNKIQIFGEDSNDQVSAIVAIAAALFVTNYVVVTGVPVNVIFSNFFGALAVVFLFLLSILMVQGLAGGETGGRFNRWVMIIAALAVASLFLSWGGLGFVFPSGTSVASGAFLTTTTFMTLLVILFAAGLVWYVTRSGGGGGGGGAGDGEADEAEA